MDYKESLESANNLRKDAIDLDGNIRANHCEIIFPELKESNDERIRKALIDFFNRGAENGEQTNGICDKDILAWLEKQGDKEGSQVYETEDGEIITYTESEGYKVIEPKFKIGDWIISHYNHIAYIKSIDDKDYILSCNDGNTERLSIDCINRNWRLWTIQDAKEGDVLVDKYGNIGIFQKCKGICWHSYIYLGCDGEVRGFKIGGSHIQSDTHLATKEQRDTLFAKIKEIGHKL